MQPLLMANAHNTVKPVYTLHLSEEPGIKKKNQDLLQSKVSVNNHREELLEWRGLTPELHPRCISPATRVHLIKEALPVAN